MPALTAIESASTRLLKAQTAKIRVFIVDDHPLIRTGLAQLLACEPDMDICGDAATAEVAFNDISRLKPDVVILDLSLDGNSGLELIKSVKSLDPAIGIIVVSMHSESIYGLRSLRAGARGYVMKGEAPNKVVDAIRQIRSGRVFASRDLTTRIVDSIRNGVALNSETPVSKLSDRELEVVELIGKGNTTNEVASLLHVSVKTIETHRAHIKQKLLLENSAQLVHFCVRWVQEHDTPGNAAGF